MKFKFIQFGVICAAMVCFFWVRPAKAAGNAIFEFKADHTDNTYYVGQDILVDVWVKPNGEVLNVSRAFMNYQVNGTATVKSWTLGSQFPYMSPGRELNATTGIINQGGYILLPDLVTTDGIFGQLKFSADHVGSYIINFTDQSHLIDPNPPNPPNEPLEKINLAGCQPITIYVIEQTNQAPIFDALNNNVSLTVGQNLNIHIRATDPLGDLVKFISTNVPTSANFGVTADNALEAEGDLTWLLDTVGTHHAIFTVTDINSSPKTTTLDITITVLPAPNQPPVFDVVATQNVNINNSVNFHVKAADPNGDLVKFLANSLPVGATFNITKDNANIIEGNFSWIPTVLGVYHAIFNAADNNATDPKTAALDVTINVTTPANRPPVFVPIGSRNILPGQTVNFTVNASDPDGDLIALSWVLPSGADFTNVINNRADVSGNFSFTPNIEGVYYAVFQALDDSPLGPLMATMTVTINVNVPGNHPPIIADVPEQIVNAGEAVTFDLVATDPDGNNVKLTSQLPSGATFIAPAPTPNVTGRFAWSPTISGEYYVLFTATDDHPTQPLSSSKSVRILVFGGACPICPSTSGTTPTCPSATILGIRITGSTIVNAQTLGETDNRLKVDINFTGIAESITKTIRLHDNTTGQTYEFAVTDPAAWESIISDNMSVGIHKFYAEAIDANGFAFAISPIYELNIKMPEKSIISQIIPTEIIKTITETQIVKEIQEKFLDNKKVEEATIDTAPVLATLAVALTVPAVTASAIGFLPFFSLIFTEPLSMLFYRRRKKWGQIYDSLSKRPLDLAIVRLYNVKTRDIALTKVTDKDGRFILNIKEPGDYYLTVTKPNYVFPTSYLKNDKQDNQFMDIYHGELIQVKEPTIITPNIPVDPVDKPEMPKSQVIWDHFKARFKKFLSYLGLILAIISYLIKPTWFMGGLVIFHLLLNMAFRRISTPKMPKSWGIIYDQQSKKPLKNAVVRIFDNRFNKLLDTQVTDTKGRYTFLVGQNQYTIRSDKDGYSTNQITPLDLTKKDKIVNLDLGLSKKL